MREFKDIQKALIFLNGYDTSKRLKLFYKAIMGKIRASNGYYSSSIHSINICWTPTMCHALLLGIRITKLEILPILRAFQKQNGLSSEDREYMFAEDTKAKLESTSQS